MSVNNDISKIQLKAEDYICSNCKYYGCDRSRNCDTICDKWSLSELALEELFEQSEQ